MKDLKVAVDVPEPFAKLKGFRDTESPVLGDTVAASSTGDENPFSGSTFTSEVAVCPEAKLTELLAVIVNPGEAEAVNLNIAVALWLILPDVPMIVTA